MKRKKGYEKIAILLMVFILFIGVLPVPDALAGTQNKKVHVKLKLDTKELVWLSGEETELKITGSVDKSSRVVYFTQDMEGYQIMFILISMKDIYSRERAFLYAQMDFGVSRIQNS